MSDPEILPDLRRMLDLPSTERPTSSVRDAVLRAARSIGPAERGGEPVRRVVAPYRAEAAKLRRLLAAFAGRREWDVPLPAAEGWTVLELVAHLAAVDGVLLAALAPGLAAVTASGLRADELAERTAVLQREQRRRPPRETVRLWWSQVEGIDESIGAGGPELLDRVIPFVGGPTPVREALVDRAFETWIHADDIRGATGHSLSPPAPAHLGTMVELAVRVVSRALDARWAGGPPARASLVLTGDVAGVRDLTVGDPAPTHPAATITVDTVELCRLIGGRRSVDDFTATIAGDLVLGRAVLQAAASLARP